MKCQILFVGKKKKKNISKCCLLKFLPLGDNLHAVSDPIFYEDLEKISSICCLLTLPLGW